MNGSLFHALDELPPEPHVITIGSFDGVHRGHQYLLEHVINGAREKGISSLAITFDPLPAEVLRPDMAPSRLCSTSDRTAYIRECGVDRVVLLEFDQTLSQQTADEFLSAVLASARPVRIVVGEDFAFGNKRQGTPDFLRKRARDGGFELEIVPRVNPDGLELSSSAVRRALAEQGDVVTAANILGRAYRLSGTVRDGDRRGRELGYPTANLNLPPNLTFPADGIYAALATAGNPTTGSAEPALVYVGTRPTFGQSERIVEAYLLDFNGDLYGADLAVEFVDRIRGDRRFESADELVEQMHRDEEAGRRIFAERGIEVAAPER